MNDHHILTQVFAAVAEATLVLLVFIEILMHHAPASVEVPLVAKAAAALGLAALNGYLAGAALGWWTILGVDVSSGVWLR